MCDQASAANAAAVYLSHDDGRSWQPVSTDNPASAGLSGPGPMSIDMVTTTAGWATEDPTPLPLAGASAIGSVLTTTDGGHTWHRVLARTVPGHAAERLDIQHLAAQSAHAAWVVGTVVGGPPVLLHTTNGGLTWTSAQLPSPAPG